MVEQALGQQVMVPMEVALADGDILQSVVEQALLGARQRHFGQTLQQQTDSRLSENDNFGLAHHRVYGVSVDRHVKGHAGKVEYGAHGVAAEKQPRQKADNLVAQPTFQPEDEVEQKEQPFIQALEGIDAVPSNIRRAYLQAD